MKITVKGFVHHQINRYAPAGAEPVLRIFAADMTKHLDDHILLGTVDVEYELPENFNPVQSEISGLEAKLGVLADDYHRNVTAIRDRISNLQCIEHSPAGEL